MVMGPVTFVPDRGPKDNAATPATRGQQIETREQAHQTDPTNEEIHLKQAEVSVQALSVIVQYLAHQVTNHHYIILDINISNIDDTIFGDLGPRGIGSALVF